MLPRTRLASPSNTVLISNSINILASKRFSHTTIASAGAKFHYLDHNVFLKGDAEISRKTETTSWEHLSINTAGTLKDRDPTTSILQFYLKSMLNTTYCKWPLVVEQNRSCFPGRVQWNSERTIECFVREKDFPFRQWVQASLTSTVILPADPSTFPDPMVHEPFPQICRKSI